MKKCFIWSILIMIALKTAIATELVFPDLSPSLDNINIGGGYSNGGISFYGTGTNKGNGYFAGNLLVAGNLTSVRNVNVNGSFMPYLDASYDLGNGTNRWRNANFSGNVFINTLELVTKLPSRLIDLNDLGSIFSKYNNENFTSNYATEYSNTGWKLINATSSGFMQGKDFNIGNVSNNTVTPFNNSISLWNISGTNIYPRELSGNVGIGTTSPGYLLHVNKTGAGASSLLAISNSQAAASGVGTGLAFFGHTDGRIMANITSLWTDTAGDNANLVFIVRDASNTPQERMRIRYDGNVGIGTTGPATTLETSGIIRASQPGTPARFFQFDPANKVIRYDGGAGDTVALNFNGVTSTGRFDLSFDNSPKVTVLQGGSVGIGTTNPGTTLNLVGGSTIFNEGLKVQRNTVPAQYSLLNYNGGNLNLVAVNTAGTGTYLNFAASNDGTSTISRMFIDNNGNVGINTTSPANTLTVQGTLNVTSQPTRSGDLFVASSGNVGINTTTPANTLTVQGTLNVTPYNLAGSGLFVSSSGFVGINISNPGAPLDVEGSAPTSDLINLQTTGTNKRTTILWRSSGIGFGLGIPSGQNRFDFNADTTGINVAAATIDSLGKFGINQTSPSQTLDVVGTLSVKSGQSGNSQGLFQNPAGNVGIGTTGPGVKLEVISSNGDIARFGSDATNTLLIQVGGAISSLIASGTRPFTITTNGLERLRIDGSNGNVGIGTTAPASTLTIVGNFSATGTKSAVVNTNQGMVQLYAIESPEVRFYDEGNSNLINGFANITLNSLFKETIESNYRVFLSSQGDSNGLFVSEITPDYFVVKENLKGKSNIKFSYLISGYRVGYNTTRLNVVAPDYKTFVGNTKNNIKI